MTMTPDSSRGPHVLLPGGLWFPYSPRVEDVRAEHFRALASIHRVRVAWALRENGFDDETVLAGLIHDAHEVYPPGDQLAPVKWAHLLPEGEGRSVAEGIRLLEGPLRGVFSPEVKRAVDTADMVLLATEARDLCGYERGNPEHDAIWGELPEPLEERITTPWTEWTARSMWEAVLKSTLKGAAA